MTSSNHPATVPVIDLDGRPLSPCSVGRAQENIDEGLARWDADGVLHLNYRPLAYRRIYRQVYRRDGYSCAWCGGPGSTLDHVIPVSWGGQTSMDNCVVACRACNHSRNNLLPSEFLTWTGLTPRHPVVQAVLAHEKRLLRAADRALRHRPIQSCRSKEEAAAWAAYRSGHPELLNRNAPREYWTRIRAVPILQDLYIP